MQGRNEVSPGGRAGMPHYMNGTRACGAVEGEHGHGAPDSFAAMEALLLLGGNEGDPSATLSEAERRLFPEAGALLGRSRDHWTVPWGFTDARLFLNRALLLATPMTPEALLAHCLGVEAALGRRRTGVGYGPRPIDIDVLWMNGLVRLDKAPLLPHPRMHERAFALGPAADLCPDHVHPLLGRTILDLLNDVAQPHA